jgi:exopolyphosphatase/guanosine-5'-triphosphate,3'-diphosphate pyrophosphatase
VPDLARSLPLGAGRSTVRFLPDDPPTEDEVARLRTHAASVLREAVGEFRELDAPQHVVGSSKTIRSLARLAGANAAGLGPEERSTLTLAALDDWTPRLARIPAAARPALPGITADRTFQIVAGAVVLSEAMRAFRVRQLDVSPWALREGLILRRLDRLS